jgi:hypothetical protein
MKIADLTSSTPLQLPKASSANAQRNGAAVQSNAPFVPLQLVPTSVLEKKETPNAD